VDAAAFHYLRPEWQQASIFCKDAISGEAQDGLMKRIGLLLVAFAALAGMVAFWAPASGHAGEAADPILGGAPPPGYRDWKLISVAHEEGNLNDLRAILGNDAAITAYREGKLPFPDGTIIARLAWSYESSEENNKVFGRSQSFVAGLPKNGIQFMVKDSRKYAATGGWGFAEFINGKPAGEAVLRTCYPCHEPVKARDFVFTRYAP
jgi:Cytochrome P460